jgi:hypothetical protein
MYFFTACIFQLDQGTLGIGRGARDYYLNATMFAHHLNAYKKYARRVIGILQSDLNVSRVETEIERDLEAIIDFEKKLANVILLSLRSFSPRSYYLRLV